MVKEYLNGNFNENKTSALILKANLLEEKIMTNNLQDQNTDVDKILELQSEITAITIFLRNSLKINKISDKNKNKAKHFFDNKHINIEGTFLRAIENLIKIYNQSEKLINDLNES